jgi:hypothetical protein
VHWNRRLRRILVAHLVHWCDARDCQERAQRKCCGVRCHVPREAHPHTRARRHQLRREVHHEIGVVCAEPPK